MGNKPHKERDLNEKITHANLCRHYLIALVLSMYFVCVHTATRYTDNELE
jgi:hypothetical protein